MQGPPRTVQFYLMFNIIEQCHFMNVASGNQVAATLRPCEIDVVNGISPCFAWLYSFGLSCRRFSVVGCHRVVSEPPVTTDCNILSLQACPHEQHLVLIHPSPGQLAELLDRSAQPSRHPCRFTSRRRMGTSASSGARIQRVNRP